MKRQEGIEKMLQYISKSPEDTQRLAAELGKRVREGLVLCLRGELGAGKTCFVQGLTAALGIQEPAVSPTYNLMNIYEGRRIVYHFDLYRLVSEEELEEIGFYEDAEDTDCVVLIEWPDRFTESLPENYIMLDMEKLSEGERERQLTFTLQGEKFAALFEELKQLC